MVAWRDYGADEHALGDRRASLQRPRRGLFDHFRRRGEQGVRRRARARRSEEHTSELQSLMRISYAVFCLKKKKYTHILVTAIKTKYHTKSADRSMTNSS